MGEFLSICLCLAQVWMNNSEAKSIAIAENGHEKLATLLTDNVPEVRASAMYALSTFLSDPNKSEQIINIEHNIAISSLCVMSDGSPMVRRELVNALSHIVHQAGSSKFLEAASQTIEEDHVNDKVLREVGAATRQPEWHGAFDSHFGSSSYDSVYIVLWKALLNLSVDPHPDVSKSASIIVDHVISILLSSPLIGEYASNLAKAQQASALAGQGFTDDQDVPRSPVSALARRPTKLTRSVSFASTLRTIYNFANAPHQEQLNSNSSDRRSSKSTHNTNDEPVLPLSSTFYEWSCEYFTEPQMRASEADEPGSVIYTQRKWRRSRNENILQESNLTKGMAGKLNIYS